MARALTLLVALLLPLSVFGATVAADEMLDVSVSPFDNAYLAGAEVRIKAPLPADLVVSAGTLLVTAPVEGDVLAAGGTVDLAAPVKGDVRALGGRIVIAGEVGGDIAAAGGAVTISGSARDIRALGGTVEIVGGSFGPVFVYGGAVVLGGTFEGDVRVAASDSVTLQEGTVIKGSLLYNAPQEASIPASVVIENGVRYTGSLAFLPTEEEAKTFALAGLGVFFLVKLVALALSAGLFAGLFPTFARRLADEALFRSWKRFLLFMLLGFAVLVATPALVLLLIASFVGAGIAMVLGSAYLLVLFLASLYGALFAGVLLVRVFFKRVSVSFKTALLGSLSLSLVGLIPFFGPLLTFVFFAASLGTLTFVFYRFAFGRAEMG